MLFENILEFKLKLDSIIRDAFANNNYLTNISNYGNQQHYYYANRNMHNTAWYKIVQNIMTKQKANYINKT